ncbi:MAG: carbohydrate ABC transporter permease [Spirochaetia bacterium]|nr:carbohydrate ABC transporter permease [Spirochaetia bacterium]
MPLVILMSRLKMMNTTGLILLAIGSSTCEAVFLYVGFLDSIPRSMEDAACIDGATTAQTFRLIIFPLMRPIIATVLIKNGLWMWNDFMMPLIILNRTWKNWTLTLYQYNFQSKYTTNYALAFAAFVISMLPIMIFYVFMQKDIIGGLTNGAVKD